MSISGYPLIARAPLVTVARPSRVIAAGQVKPSLRNAHGTHPPGVNMAGKVLVPVGVHRLGEQEDEAADDRDARADPEQDPVRPGYEGDAAHDETDDDNGG